MGILSNKPKDWSAEEKIGLRKWTPRKDNEKQHVFQKAWQNEEKKRSAWNLRKREHQGTGVSKDSWEKIRKKEKEKQERVMLGRVGVKNMGMII